MKYVDAMGAELGEAFSLLTAHLSDLYLTWKQYEELFAGSEETVAILNDSAPTFFAVIQGQLWDSVMIGISRLTDPPTMRSRENLSVLALPSLISEAALKTKVEERCASALSDAHFARQHRNRRIAHNDFNYARDRTAHPLPGASRDKITTSLASIGLVLNAVNGHYLETTTLYEDVIFSGGAGRLVRLLQGASRKV